MLKRLLLSVMLFIGVIAPLWSDEIIRSDGEVFTGVIQKTVPDQYVIIKTDMGRTYHIRWNDIEQLNGQAVPHLQKDDLAEGLTSTAQPAGPSGWVQVDLGGSVPLQPENFPKYWSPGVLAGTALYFPLTDQLAWGLGAHYSFHPLDNQKFLTDIKPVVVNGSGTVLPVTNIEGGGISLFSLTADLRWNFLTRSTPVSPYMKIGGGFMSRSIRAATYSNGTVWTRDKEETATGGALQAGAGVDFFLDSRNSIMVEGKAALGSTQDQNILVVPFSMGYEFRF